jgi:hypothetical protein
VPSGRHDGHHRAVCGYMKLAVPSFLAVLLEDTPVWVLETIFECVPSWSVAFTVTNSRTPAPGSQ